MTKTKETKEEVKLICKHMDKDTNDSCGKCDVCNSGRLSKNKTK